MATFIELYISENMKTSDLLNLSVFPDDFGFVNDFLSLLLHFKHQILISEDDEIISVLKSTWLAAMEICLYLKKLQNWLE